MGGRGLATAFLCLLLVSAAGAQDLELAEGLDQVLSQGSIDLDADFLEYERSRGLYTAKGNVVLRQSERTIRADWVSFNQVTGVGVASGNVVVEEEGNVLRASFIEFNVYGSKGVVRDGSFDSSANQFRAGGRVIEKTGPDTYSFRDGVFTTCRCLDDEGPPPWAVKAKEAEVEVEGYAVVRNSTVEVLGVPVMWLPWMIFPVKTQRQSGLLLPQVEWSNRQGLAGEQPVFLALHDQVNLTVTPGWSSTRGGRGRAEVETVFGEASSAQFMGAYARDLSIDPDLISEPFDENRYVLKGGADIHAPGGLRLRARSDVVSDNQAPLDMHEARRQHADRRITSEGWIGRSFGPDGRYGAVVDVRISDDMQNPDDRDRDQMMLQRLPGASAAVLPAAAPQVPRLVTAVDFDYAYFGRLGSPAPNEFVGALDASGDFLDVGVDGVGNSRERAFPSGDVGGGDQHGDDFDTSGGTEGDGRFQEGEILTDRGHRFSMHPRVAAPFQAGRFMEVYPELGWHQTFYDTDNHDFVERGFFTARLDMRSRLRGRIGSWTHIVEPQAGWALALTSSHRDDPLFVPRTAVPQRRLRALELDNLTRDDADRLSKANAFTVGVTNRFLSEDGRHGADVTVLALYDFVSDTANQIVADANLRNAWGLQGQLQLAFDPAAERVDDGLIGVGWRHESGLQASLRYEFVRDIPDTFEDFRFGDRWDDAEPSFDEVHQLRGGVQVPLTAQWLVGYRGSYSFERKQLFSSAASFEYFSTCGCWSAGVEFSGDIVSGIGFRVLYSIEGFGFSNLPGDRGVLDGI